MARPVDELGRIVIPKEIRRSFKINEKDLLEIFIEGENIILKKVKNVCTLCGSDEDLELTGEKHICKKCIARIAAMQN